MRPVSRVSTVALAAMLVVGSASLTACSGAAKEAVQSAAQSAVSAALDKASQGEITDALGNLDDAQVKSTVCTQLKDNAQGLYDQVIAKVNEKKAGAGDTLKSAVSLDQFKSFVQEKCA